MKKQLLLIMLLCLAVFSVFAIGEQKIYPVDCEEYQLLSDVYLACGYAMPSSTGPWSLSELEMMFNKIKTADMPDYIKPVYERLKTSLSVQPDKIIDSFGITAKGTVSVYTYGHTNTEIQGHESFKADTRIPTASFDLDFSYGDNVHFFFNPALQNSEISSTPVGATNVFTNIMLFQNLTQGGDFDMSMPNRAYAAFGNDYISFEIGRDRLSWGLGKTGNVTISNNIPRHDMARFTVFSNNFKFTYLVDSFPHKSNYYSQGNGSGQYDISKGDSFALSGINMYIGHRLEGRFFNDKLSLTVTEAMMFSTSEAYLNLSVLNPAMLFHDLYQALSSNSTLAFEADFTPIKNLNVYGQFLIDDFAGPGEGKTSDTTQGQPNAFGFVLGATYLTAAPNGTAKFNVEFAEIDPYTYLRYSNSAYSNGEDEIYGLDYVVAMRFYQMATNTALYEEFVMGYQYGPDCMVGNLNATYSSYDGKLKLAANLFAMAHGTHDIWTSWMRTGNNEDWKDDYYTPTTRHLTANRNDTEAQDRNAVEYTVDFGLAGQYKLLDNLKLEAQADVVTIWNFGNMTSENVVIDWQLMVGASYSF